jgi:hypothetical protein
MVKRFGRRLIAITVALQHPNKSTKVNKKLKYHLNGYKNNCFVKLECVPMRSMMDKEYKYPYSTICNFIDELHLYTYSYNVCKNKQVSFFVKITPCNMM